MSNPQPAYYNSFVPAFPLKELLETFEIELTQQLDYYSMIPKYHQALTQYLMADLQALRFNLFIDTAVIDETWAVIRQNDTVTDFILELTTQLVFHANAIETDGYDALVRLVAQSIGVFQIDDKKYREFSALESAKEADRFVGKDEATAYLKANPWLVTLFVLRRTQTVRSFIAEMAQRAQLERATAERNQGGA